jgi:hypothetical protein
MFGHGLALGRGGGREDGRRRSDRSVALQSLSNVRRREMADRLDVIDWWHDEGSRVQFLAEPLDLHKMRKLLIWMYHLLSTSATSATQGSKR